MTSRLGTYTPAGDADPGRARRALAFDALAGLVLTMLVWPFPAMRASLPWAIHIPVLLGSVVVTELVYASASVAVWGRTPVMYLLDLGLEGPPRPFGVVRSLRWGAGFALACVVAAGAAGTADPSSGLPARLSGLVTSATA